MAATPSSILAADSHQDYVCVFFHSSVSKPAKPQSSSAISWITIWVCSGFLPRVRTSVSVNSFTIMAFCSRVVPGVICRLMYGICSEYQGSIPEPQSNRSAKPRSPYHRAAYRQTLQRSLDHTQSVLRLYGDVSGRAVPLQRDLRPVGLTRTGDMHICWCLPPRHAPRLR
jgi:hypothetical protein